MVILFFPKLHYNYQLSFFLFAGWICFLFSLALFAILIYFGFPVTMVTERPFGLIFAASSISLLLSLYLYRRSQQAKDYELAPAGNTGEIENQC